MNITRDEMPHPTLEALVTDVARAYRLLPEEVWEGGHPGANDTERQSTGARANDARRVVYVVLWMLGHPTRQIGVMMNRDHSTVGYHLRQATPEDQRRAAPLAAQYLIQAVAA